MRFKFMMIAVGIIGLAGLFSCPNSERSDDASRERQAPPAPPAISDMFSKAVEDHSGGYDYPDMGIYYEYDFRNRETTWNNPEQMLNRLEQAGIEVQSAWYRPEENSCRPPGSDVALMVVVPPRFIVRLDTPTDKILEVGFVKPSSLEIFCGHHVVRYDREPATEN